MSTAEIIAQLSHLSPEARAEVRAKLDELVDEDSVVRGLSSPSTVSHIRSPRLADPRQTSAFRKEVVEFFDDASL